MVIETGHQVAMLLSSKRNSKGKIKAPFDSDVVRFRRRCQEARDQIQLDTVQSRAQLSLANATSPSSANAWGALRFRFGKQETEGAQHRAGAERSPRTFILQAPHQAFPGDRQAQFHSFARMQAPGYALQPGVSFNESCRVRTRCPATGREEEEGTG